MGERGLAGAKRRVPPRESGEALLYKLQLAQAGSPGRFGKNMTDSEKNYDK